MVQTAVTPQKTDFDMSISMPIDYVGKEVYVLFYIDEEVKKHPLRFYQNKNRLISLAHLAGKMAKNAGLYNPKP